MLNSRGNIIIVWVRKSNNVSGAKLLEHSILLVSPLISPKWTFTSLSNWNEKCKTLSSAVYDGQFNWEKLTLGFYIFSGSTFTTL